MVLPCFASRRQAGEGRLVLGSATSRYGEHHPSVMSTLLYPSLLYQLFFFVVVVFLTYSLLILFFFIGYFFFLP
jgi:hypothetical protein